MQGGVIPPVLRGFDAESKFFPETVYVDKAKALLAEAGVTKRQSSSRRRLYNVPNAVASIQVVQQDWEAAGFEPEIETMDLASFAQVILSKVFVRRGLVRVQRHELGAGQGVQPARSVHRRQLHQLRELRRPGLRSTAGRLRGAEQDVDKQNCAAAGRPTSC